ncbi:MAG TPA: hypothetical protein VGH54_19860 [Mycobacterium sp.]|jgi:hypothetical protein|uniref:hypothetical protein n=1 Tax=Mycobacterium sp. TaxID=1785 RepID=UPI002F3E9A50
MPARAPAPAGEITLNRIGRTMARVPIEGLTPLIVNKFSEKAQQIMLARQMGATLQREPKNPEELFLNAQHLLADGSAGFPAVGFKAAIVDAARFFKGSKLTMTDLRRMFFVNGVPGVEKANRTLLTPVYGKWTGDTATLQPAEPVMRQDYARNDSGVADIRFRPEYDPWSAVLEVVYIKSLFKLDTVIALVDAAGMNGIGEWRPASKESNTGSYGTWRVPDDADVKEITL